MLAHEGARKELRVLAFFSQQQEKGCVSMRFRFRGVCLALMFCWSHRECRVWGQQRSVSWATIFFG